MVQCRPAEIRTEWRLHASLRHLLASVLLTIAVGAPANADDTKVTALAKPLDLVVYRAGTTPPHFAGPTLDAQQISTTGLRGKVVIMNFWASWCHECRPEMPALERLHRDYAARGLAVVGINARENSAAMRRYAQEVGLSFPLVLDPDGKINALYGVIGLPTTFVIGRDGRAVALATGARHWGSPAARTLIEALLAEPAPR